MELPRSNNFKRFAHILATAIAFCLLSKADTFASEARRAIFWSEISIRFPTSPELIVAVEPVSRAGSFCIGKISFRLGDHAYSIESKELYTIDTETLSASWLESISDDGRSFTLVVPFGTSEALSRKTERNRYAYIEVIGMRGHKVQVTPP